MKLAEALVALGVGAGDRVAIYMPMAPEAAVASHACAHIGAIQVPIFSGFAAPAVVQRLQDSGAKAVITADYSLRRGARVPMRETIEEAQRESPTVEHVVEWSRDDRSWDVELGPGELPPLEVEAEHPYLLAYTSGTTGRPKGALHVHGGFLLSIAREAAYQADIRAGDRVLFATDMGWIMGPWTVVGAGARRRCRRLHGGRARPSRRPALAADRGRAGDDARRLAHTDPGADPEGRAPAATCRRCARSRRPASRGTRGRTTGSTSTSRAAAGSRS